MDTRLGLNRYFLSHCSVQTSKKPVSFSCILLLLELFKTLKLKTRFYLKMKKIKKNVLHLCSV